MSTEILGHVYWPRTRERDRIMVRFPDEQITMTGSGFLHKSWEGQFLETFRDFCRQEGIELTLPPNPESSEVSPLPAEARS